MAATIEFYDWQIRMMQAVEDPRIEQIAVLGSRGPGKSWMLRKLAIIRCLQYPGTAHILFRRTSDDIVKQYLPALRNDLRNFGGVAIPFAENKQYKTIEIFCPNGGSSLLYLAFAETVKHSEKYMGQEYMTILFDEITHFEEVIYDLIAGSMRGDKRVKKIVAGNPGGIGHSWVKRRFVERATRDAHTVCLRPKLSDNLELLMKDPRYADRLLRGLPEWKKKQWLDGDWDAMEGQYFQVPPGCIRLIHPPQWAKWYAGVDWGYSPSAFGVLWVACWLDYQGRPRAHVYAELKAHKLTDPQQARAALEVEETLPRPPHLRVADPSTGRRNAGAEAEESRTTALTWARNGFHTVPAHRWERVPGWALVRQLLDPVDGYSPDPESPHGILTISPNCRCLITEMNTAQFETRNGVQSGDDLTGEDHLLDPLRYVIARAYNMTYPIQPNEPYDYKMIAA